MNKFLTGLILFWVVVIIWFIPFFLPDKTYTEEKIKSKIVVEKNHNFYYGYWFIVRNISDTTDIKVDIIPVYQILYEKYSVGDTIK